MTTTTNASEYVGLRETTATTRTRTGHRPLRPGRVALYALLVAAALSALFPILWMISGSMQSLPELLKGDALLPAVPQWQNFATAWVKGNLAVYMTNSIIYTLCAVAGILLVSSLAGYALTRLEFKGKGIFTALILAVMIIPAPAMFLAQYKVLLALDLANTRQGYIFILITSGIPISTLIMRSFFASQPQDLEEAAALDATDKDVSIGGAGLAAAAIKLGLVTSCACSATGRRRWRHAVSAAGHRTRPAGADRDQDLRLARDLRVLPARPRRVAPTPPSSRSAARPRGLPVSYSPIRGAATALSCRAGCSSSSD